MGGHTSVITDVGPYALLYKQYGADQLMDAGFSEYITKGYSIQAEADHAAASGNTDLAMRLQRDAAIQFAYHEQIETLQPMYDALLFDGFFNVNEAVLEATDGRFGLIKPDIYVGTNRRMNESSFIIPMPEWVSSYDLGDGDMRMDIAYNAYHVLHNRSKEPESLAIIRNAIGTLGGGLNLYQPVWSKLKL